MRGPLNGSTVGILKRIALACELVDLCYSDGSLSRPSIWIGSIP